MELLNKKMLMDYFYQVINNEAADGNIQHTFFLADMTIKCGFAARFVDSVVFQGVLDCSLTSPFLQAFLIHKCLFLTAPFGYSSMRIQLLSLG